MSDLDLYETLQFLTELPHLTKLESREQMPGCCSIPPCPKKVSEGLQQVAESYSFLTSSSTSQPPARVPP